MDKSSLGDRMKIYECVTKNFLMRRSCTLIRCDGKAFHSLTKGFDKPFDEILMATMQETTAYLCANIQGCKIGYTQSDEISLLLTDYDTLTTCMWFDGNIQKMASVSASMATMAFNKIFCEKIEDITCFEPNKFNKEKLALYRSKMFIATFDSRVFSIPKDEVCNYFIWRQQDATRNSIQMYGHANFSHAVMENKNCNEIQEMLFTQKGINWNDAPVTQKRGACVIKESFPSAAQPDILRSRWVSDKNIPIFTEDREYIEKYI